MMPPPSAGDRPDLPDDLSALLSAGAIQTRMPGESYRGPLAELTGDEPGVRDRLRRDIAVLAEDIGPRSIPDRPHALAAAADYLEGELSAAGYIPERQPYEAGGHRVSNLIAELRGSTRPDEIVVVGAHYDSIPGCPAANDNGSGCAATLALARALAGRPRARTIRWVLFVNEEPPWYYSDQMGSLVHARACHARGERIMGMWNLETLGYHDDTPGSQNYDPPLGMCYPSEGNFIAFVGNTESREWVLATVGAFRSGARIASEGLAAPGWLPWLGASDHWSFWQQGYPALMITDTAPMRYPHYHEPTDTVDKIDFHRLTLVVSGLEGALMQLADGG